jgi:hypothetical protein
MGKHSTAATRAARRSFYTSRPLVATGRILDAVRGAQSRLLGIALVLVFVVLGSVTDFRTPLDTPCEREDSTMCYWDSNTRGNGQGQSYISITEQFRIYL